MTVSFKLCTYSNVNVTVSLAPTQNDNSLKSSQSNSMISVTEERKHKTQATKLRFLKIHGRPDVARVQLLLSNISDRALYFKLKSNVGSNVSALPSGSGHVASRGSARCVLTWHRPKNVAEWNDVEQPKLLLVTRFLDSNNEMTNDQTSTRLIARVSSKGSCSANNPPVEQFLLDAVSKTQDEGAVVSIQRYVAVESDCNLILDSPKKKRRRMLSTSSSTD